MAPVEDPVQQGRQGLVLGRHFVGEFVQKPSGQPRRHLVQLKQELAGRNRTIWAVWSFYERLGGVL